MHGVVVVESVAEVFFELGEQTGVYQSRWSGIDAGFTLVICQRNGDARGVKGRGTWPPENPTATTPRSMGAVRNLGVIVEGEVMFSASI